MEYYTFEQLKEMAFSDGIYSVTSKKPTYPL